MLRRLTVENYALIERLEMELDEHLNIITGETGAGKSILLGALGLLLGNKNDGSAIKDNTANCIIEGVFEIEGYGLESLFEQNDWDWDEEVVIRRMITPAGKSRAFINDVPVNLVDLKSLGSRLIDIHSQHQNNILSDELFREHLLDLLAENSDLRKEYRASYDSLQALKRELREVEERLERSRRDEEWLTFQVEELTVAALREGEDEELESEIAILENSDKISGALLALRSAMDDEQMGVLLQLKGCYTAFSSVAKSYAPAAEYSERLQSVLAELKDINNSVAAQSERVDADPAKLEKLSARLNVLYTLTQKHRVKSIEELIELRDRYSLQLSEIVGSSDRLEALQQEIAVMHGNCEQLAQRIHSSREAVVPQFESEIIATLSKLGMEGVQFVVDLRVTPNFTPTGSDCVEFLFSANPNMRPQIVNQIASGGEISRVMLSLKALMAERMLLPTIIFDEIDTGVSGRIADAMGEIIERLSVSIQVVDITHLPQVAAKGDTHFVVYKADGRTNISKLDSEQRINQIATMISGSEISAAALEQARILLSK